MHTYHRPSMDLNPHTALAGEHTATYLLEHIEDLEDTRTKHDFSAAWFATSAEQRRD